MTTKETTEDRVFALAASLVASFTNPALIGLIWMRGQMDTLTGYAPSYVQFLVVSLLAMWIQTPPMEDTEGQLTRLAGLAIGRSITIAGFYGLLVIIT